MAGGIDVPRVMGSSSTYTKSHIGGFEGRALRAGDYLKSGRARPAILGKGLPPQVIPEYRNQSELRVMLGPQADYFTGNGIYTFLH